MQNSHSPLVREAPEVLVRLLSILIALCLHGLQNYGSCDDFAGGFRFEVLGACDLDEDTQQRILSAKCKASASRLGGKTCVLVCLID